MQYYDFQPDLTKAYPILSQAKLILSDNIDANRVQEVLIQDLLPEAFSMLGTEVRLILVTVITYNDIAHWDLIFEYPQGYKLNLLEAIFNNSIELDDSFDHYSDVGPQYYKLSFKVG